jgi:hypothetical protein
MAKNKSTLVNSKLKLLNSSRKEPGGMTDLNMNNLEMTLKLYSWRV